MNRILVDLVSNMSAYGWDVRAYDESYLLRSVEKRVASCNLASNNDYPDLLIGNRQEAQIYYDSLQNSYTEFFRDPLIFAGLERVILPELIREKRRRNHSEVRIWSAGCASGQEAYSVAMLLNELSASDTQEIIFRIIATDTNPAELEAGRQGIYSGSALQNVNLRRLGRYFDKLKSDTYQLNSHIREMVDFSQYDLLDVNISSPPAAIFGDFDLILCCNLLIYYGLEARRRIITRLQQVLVGNGYLVTGETEKDMLNKTQDFCQVSFQSTAFNRCK